jgi:Uma2 family endonuclease
MAAPIIRRPVPFTYDDYLRMPDDGQRHELIEGELFVCPTPTTRHQVVSRRLKFALMEALEKPGLAQIFNAPTDVVLEPTTVLQPDLIIVGAAKFHLITRRAIEGVPDVAVEIASPGSFDRDHYIKFKIYERVGVPEYWMVDPEPGYLRVHRLHEDGYRVRKLYDRTGILECPEFPTLRLPLLEVFS